MFWIFTDAIRITWKRGVRFVKKESSPKPLRQELNDSLDADTESWLAVMFLRWCFVIPAALLGFQLASWIVQIIPIGNEASIFRPFEIGVACSVLAFVPLLIGALMAPCYRFIVILVGIVATLIVVWKVHSPFASDQWAISSNSVPVVAFFFALGCLGAIFAVYRREKGWRS